MTTTLEPLEAVIISGPRRGEIVRLGDGMTVDPSEDEIHALNTALDEWIAAVERLGVEVRTTLQALRSQAQRS